MSAADLFKDPFDAEFRLKGTWIMIGRDPYFVKAVIPDGKTENTILQLFTVKDEELTVRLGKLPLKAMTMCPSGYFEGLWFARGPARHRYQGITGSSLWAVMPNGSLECGGVGNVKKVLKELTLQPRTRRIGKRPSGVLTRDVAIGAQNQLYIRGRLRGEYVGENMVVPSNELSPLANYLLDNAKLSVTDVAPKKAKSDISNPCTEIIL